MSVVTIVEMNWNDQAKAGFWIWFSWCVQVLRCALEWQQMKRLLQPFYHILYLQYMVLYGSEQIKCCGKIESIHWYLSMASIFGIAGMLNDSNWNCSCGHRTKPFHTKEYRSSADVLQDEIQDKGRKGLSIHCARYAMIAGNDASMQNRNGCSRLPGE